MLSFMNQGKKSVCLDSEKDNNGKDEESEWLTVSESVEGSSWLLENDDLSWWLVAAAGWPGGPRAKDAGAGGGLDNGGDDDDVISIGSSLISGAWLESSSSLISELVDTAGNGSSRDVSLDGSFS